MECAILFIVFVVLLVFGVPIALCLVAAGALVILAGGDISPIIIGQRMFGSLDSFTIMAIPLFMLAGNLMSSGGISRRLVNFCNAILGWMPGGLGVVAVFACMLFGALSGSPTATCAAIGSIMVPSMIEAGYSKRFSLATVAVARYTGLYYPPLHRHGILLVRQRRLCRLHVHGWHSSRYFNGARHGGYSDSVWHQAPSRNTPY